MKASIAVDAGPTDVLTRVDSAAGSAIARSTGLDYEAPLAPQWAAAIISVMDAHPDLEVDEVAVSSSPMFRETAHDLLPLLLGRGVHRVAVAPEGVAGYLGALGDREGAVIHAGTVTVCLACGPRGSAQVDGWGPLFGNAGSAYWIGRTAIEAALRGHDGRRQLTSLTEMLRADFPDLDEAHIHLQATPGHINRVTAYAVRVNTLSSTDRVAANILDKAAAHLSEAVHAAIRRAGLSGPDAPAVVALGSVFDMPRVMSRFCDYLTLQWPNFALTLPVGDELDGAASLHTLPAQHPLYERISFAER